MLLIAWVVVSDSESVLLSTNVLVPVESSSACHRCLELELNSIFKWCFRNLVSFLVKEPSLVEAIVASPPGNLLVVLVFTSPDIKTHFAIVSDVSSVSIVPINFLEVFTFPWSDDSSSAILETKSDLVRDSI